MYYKTKMEAEHMEKLIENEKNEKKVRSIRADDITFDKFKSLCDELGGHSECLNSLISTYELGRAKELIPEHEVNISEFQSHADSLVRAYVSLLDISKNADNRIKSEFVLQLDSKDKIIMELQNKISFCEKEKEKAIEQTKSSSEEVENLQHNLSEVSKKIDLLNKQTEQQADLIDALKDQLKAASKQAEINLSAVSELEIIKNTVKELVSAAEKNEQEKILAEKSAKLELKAAVLEIKSEYQDKLEKANESYNKKLKEYIEKNEELNRKIQINENNSNLKEKDKAQKDS